MTLVAPRVNTIQRGGSRLYVHPSSGDKEPGVTSVLGMLPKGFLKFWAAKVVAEDAINLLPELVGLAMKDKQAAVDMLKRAPDRFTKTAADRGTEVHDLFERLARGEKAGRLHPDMEPYAAHFGRFLDKFQPEFLYLEETIWSTTHGYAGRFDCIARIDGEIAVGDWKTTRSGVHEEVALQLSAYRHADYILGADGEQTPMPEITAGFVLHARPEAAKVVPIECGPEIFEGFKHLREIYRWEKETKSTVLGRAINLEDAA